MKAARWLDHLPPWLAWAAIASTGAYEPRELAVMALPLVAALAVQAGSWRTARWQRPLELLALAWVLVLLVLRAGVLVTVVDTLFLLCGVRLCLPRGLAQRRQVLLMGFLLFTTTAVTTADLDFLVWSLAWLAGTSLVLLQQTWDASAVLGQGPAKAPPYLLAGRWCAGAAILGAGMFILLPRPHQGTRRLPVGARSLEGLRAGLADVLDLAGSGPIQGSREVALRIEPAPPAAGDLRQALGLLRGFILERLDGQRWETGPDTPDPAGVRWSGPAAGPVAADFFFSPGLLGTLPLPYGRVALESPGGDPLRFGPGASLRWTFPVRRTTSLRVALTPARVEPAPAPQGRRLALLTATGTGGDSARAWAQGVAPAALPARELAEALAGALRARFRYTLANPSGGAANPLQDFLEHSHAGHCEYFAAALALMLRYRGIPARVVNGFRLGPWIAEGGYFLVTQSEAHSWVEYYDPEAGGWRVADPTPPAPAAPQDAGTFAAALARWTDALRFRWDRNVVRFSDADQAAGLDRALGGLGALAGRLPRPRIGVPVALATLALLALAVGSRRRNGTGWPWTGPSREPGRIPELDPLVRRARRLLPPGEAETARAWLGRLARLRPQRAAQLRRLAREADAAAYGGRPPETLRRLAREESRHWKR